jgi:predicted SAM-dependent methyltransferase
MTQAAVHGRQPEPVAGVRRLNWGCGSWIQPGWINADVKADLGADVCCDIRQGLPFDDESIDYTVSIHALPELEHDALVPTLVELWRVLKPSGVLRLGLPDLDRGIDAYRDGNRDYFLVPDDHARSIGGKFIVHMLWYGFSRSLFTFDFSAELLQKAGFADISRCAFRETKSRFSEIVELDNRPAESFFVEATKPG